MHASQLLRESDFELELDGAVVGAEKILPRWSRHDRVGVVTRTPFGALRASLLMQLAMSMYYAFDPRRGGDAAQYPPVFVFCVGDEATGDYSSMDVWPARRSLHLPDDPYVVLGAIQDRAITRLIVPASPAHRADYALRAPSGWTDVHAAVEHTASAFAYDEHGELGGHDVTIRAGTANPERIVRDVLDTEHVITEFEQYSDDELLAMELGPSIPSDFHGWLKVFRTHAQEVPRAHRQALLAARGDGTQAQCFRRIPVLDALARLAPSSTATSTTKEYS
ncbi:hypothetical protein [Microbacterium sp.]|uniref:hypothetical protein n=1 Tax=Microbacterium sp. TaxID=51671 RepID=UPI003A843442